MSSTARERARLDWQKARRSIHDSPRAIDTIASQIEMEVVAVELVPEGSEHDGEQGFVVGASS